MDFEWFTKGTSRKARLKRKKSKNGVEKEERLAVLRERKRRR